MSFMVSLLENVLGDLKKHNEHKGQTQWNCPMCDNGRNKGNLEVNYNIGVYKCWSCKDINHMHGSIFNLIKRFGSKNDLDTFKLIKPDYDSINIKDFKPKFLELPAELKPLTNDDSVDAKKIKQYLYKRKIFDETISEYEMMYSTAKGFRSRVIIPSKNSDGDIEYYVSRAIYDIMEPKYRNPDYDKDNVIFFENKINWNANIYLVEGVFDAITLPNAIPLLGKYANNKLIQNLMNKAKANVIIILDGDAINDAKVLYNNLNILNLSGRVKMVELGPDDDLSDINKQWGRKGIIDVLKQAKSC